MLAVEANRRSIDTALSVDWVRAFLRSGHLSFLHAAIAPPGQGGSTITLFELPHRPEQSNAQSWLMAANGGEPVQVRTVECADLLRVYGEAVYMKIDVESSTTDCLESLYRAHGSRIGKADEELGPPLPRMISLELEATSLVESFKTRLEALGYDSYKICRQYIYSPAPCEQGAYSSMVPGCGSGPFGHVAVDYIRGPVWGPLSALQNDSAWAKEFDGGLDWFDLHAKLPD